MEIIKSYFTTGLCGTCYRELPAQIEYRSNGSAYITKTCPDHGYEEAMVERDWGFWDTATQKNPDNLTYKHYNQVTLIEATDRCNAMCKHCYHVPDNGIEDKPLDWVVKMAEIAPTRSICLAGAEPTMRKDLPELVKAIKQLIFWNGEKRTCSIYTNGIKLQNKEYLQSLADVGLDTINMSIHHPEYHEGNIWKNVSKAIINSVNSGIELGQLSFTVENKKQLNYAVDKMLWLMDQGKRPTDFCVRSPAEIGVEYESDGEVYASDISKWFHEIAQERGLKFEKHPNHGSNPYHVGHLLEGVQTIQVIHWAQVKSVDTSYMYMGPYAVMMPNTFGTFLIQSILRDGLRKGWYQGHRVMPGYMTRTMHDQSLQEIKFLKRA